MRKEIPADIGDFLELRENGVLIWKKGHKNRVGKQAGGIHKFTGYMDVKVRGERFRLHRVVFFLANGWCPESVDHIDGDKLNNEPNNLRPAEHRQNLRNTKTYSTNTSGRKGVSREYGKWCASIMVNQQSIRLGAFETFEEAVKAREVGELKYHGKAWIRKAA